MSKKKIDQSRYLAYTLLNRVLEDGAYAHLVVQNYLETSGLDKRDRSFALALFYGVLEKVYTLDFYLKKYVSRDFVSLDPAVRTILRMGAWQLLYANSVPDFAAVKESVELLRVYSNEGAVKMGNAVLRVFSKAIHAQEIVPEKETLDVQYSLSKELVGCFKKWFGLERAESILAAFSGMSSVCVRVNKLHIEPEQLREKLAQEGVAASDALLLKNAAISISLDGENPQDIKAHQDGLFMIQDEGAMLAALVAAPKPGSKTLDVCAAPGGKSCHLAELMQNNGELIALDIYPERVKKISENAQRLGISIIHAQEGDVTDFEALKRAGLEPKSFDTVLADVPCSGLGLLRRKPDIRMNMTYEKIQQLLPLQESILAESSRFVRPGGFLIYSTCTVNPKENEEQIQNFLKKNEAFAPVSLEQILIDEMGENAQRHVDEAKLGYITLLPDTDKCDGFFIAKLHRKKSIDSKDTVA